jgi:hypothetical protein
MTDYDRMQEAIDQGEISPNGLDDQLDLSRWQPIDWDLFWQQDGRISEWEVEPIIPAGRQVAIWARAKAGKSLLMLDVAAARATGRSVLGAPAREPVDVVYVDLEMSEDDLQERLEDLGYGPDCDLSRLHYYQGCSLPPMDTMFGGAVIAAICAHWSARLLVVDTMARAVTGEENSSDTYRHFHAHTGIKLRALGVGVALVDNAGKDDRLGARGSSAKDDGVDVVFGLKDVGECLVLKRTHTRVPWVPIETTIRRMLEPQLRHELTPVAYPAGTAETAALMDELGVALDASRRSAQQALKEAGHGRRADVVGAALKYRRRPV